MFDYCLSTRGDAPFIDGLMLNAKPELWYLWLGSTRESWLWIPDLKQATVFSSREEALEQCLEGDRNSCTIRVQELEDSR